MKLDKGLYKDTHAIDQIDGTYPNARNILINKIQGAVTNELGFDKIHTLTRKIIGSIPVTDDEIIIFSRDDDSDTIITNRTVAVYLVEIPANMTGNLTITYTNNVGIVQSETVIIDDLPFPSGGGAYTYFINGGVTVTQTDSTTPANNFSVVFSDTNNVQNIKANLTFSLETGSELNILEEVYYSEIGRYKDGSYTKILESSKLKFRSDSFIKGCYVLNYKREIIIAFTDDKNPPKILNIDTLPFDVDPTSKKLLDEDDLVLSYLFPEYSKPRIVYNTILDNGGALRSGAYFLSFAYELEDGSVTNYTPLEGPFIVTNSTLELSGSYRQDQQSNFDLTSEYDGCEPDTPTSKSIKFILTDIDTRYKYVHFSVYKKIGGVVTSEFVKRIEIASFINEEITDDTSIETSNDTNVSSENNFEITYTGKETSSTLLLEDITVGNDTYQTAKTITYFDSKLFLGNVTSNPDFNYQPYAMNIKAHWERDYVDINSVKGSYKNELLVFNKRGFRPDEVYAFYISFLYNDGTWSGAYHIPGRDKMLVTVALKDQNNKYLNPISIDETIPLKDIVLGDVSQGVITAGDRTKYERIFNHDIGINPDTRYFQTRETARVDGRLGFWQNENEKYPLDPETWGETNAGQPVRHHKMPNYATLNGVNTSFPDESDAGDFSGPAAGTGDLVVIAFMDDCEIDTRPSMPTKGQMSFWSNNKKNTAHNVRYNRQTVKHHLYLYVGTASPTVPAGYYFLAETYDPREFTDANGPYAHFLTNDIDIAGNMRRGGYEHNPMTPQQVSAGTLADLKALYPNLLTMKNTNKLADGLEQEYQGAGMGSGLNTPIPELPLRTSQKFEYVYGNQISNYNGKIVGHYYWKWYKKPWCLSSAHHSGLWGRRWGEGKYKKGCGRVHSWVDYRHRDVAVFTEKIQPSVFVSWWNDSSNQVGSNNGNGIKTIRAAVDYNYSASLGNYTTPSFISSQPYDAEGVASLKQTGSVPDITSSGLSPKTFDDFHYNSTGSLDNQVAISALSGSTLFATSVTGTTPYGVWSNGNYTYKATEAHTLLMKGKFGVELLTKNINISNSPTVDQVCISGIRKITKQDITDESTWTRTDVFRNKETNSRKLVTEAEHNAQVNDTAYEGDFKLITSTKGGDFTSLDVNEVFRPDFTTAISLQVGDVIQFYHETTCIVEGEVNSNVPSNTTLSNRITYDLDIQILSYPYMYPEPVYGPYSMYASICGVRFSNIEIPRELKDRVQGYQFFYARRDERNTRVYDQSIAFHGAPHALHPNEEGSYAGHLIPLGNLNLEATNKHNSVGTTAAYSGSDWHQTSFDLNENDLGKQHKINPNSLRFHGFDVLNTKPTVQSAYMNIVSRLSGAEFTDIRTINHNTHDAISNADGLNDSTSFSEDTANEGALGKYTTLLGKNSTIDTTVQASYNQIWNRAGTSTSIENNVGFALVDNDFNILRQLQSPSYLPGDGIITKNSITVNNTWGEECFHAQIVHYDKEEYWSEIDHHTGFMTQEDKNVVVLGQTVSKEGYKTPAGWRKIKSHYYNEDNGTDSTFEGSTVGPAYNLVDLLSYKTDVYNSFYDQTLVSTLGYNKLSLSDKARLLTQNSIIKNTGVIFGGDTFVGMYGVRLTAPLFYSGGKSTNTWYYSDNKFNAVKNIFYFPRYSSSNTSLRNDKDSFIDSYYPKCSVGSMANGNTETTVNTVLDQKKQALHNYRARAVDATNTNALHYNEDYTSINSYNTTTTYDNRNKFLDKFPYRVIRSQAYGQENKTMTLKVFKTNDYYEMPKDRGSITNLEGLGKHLLIHHEFALFRTTTQDVIATDTAQASLGTGDIFQFAPTELLTAENGYAGTQNLSSILVSKAGYSFVDREQGKVFIVSDKLEEISNRGMRNWFQNNLDFENTQQASYDTAFNLGGSGYTTAFDEDNNRLILSKKDLKLNTTLYTDVSVPTTYKEATPYCVVDSDGNNTGYVGYTHLNVYDQWGQLIGQISNSSSHVGYVAPVINTTLCPGKPNIALSWNAAGAFEGAAPTLNVTLSEIQEVDFYATVAYSGTFTAPADGTLPATSITIPQGYTTVAVSGTTISDDTIEGTETIIATLTNIEKYSEDSSGNQSNVPNAAIITVASATYNVYDCPVLANDSVTDVTLNGTAPMSFAIDTLYGIQVAEDATQPDYPNEKRILTTSGTTQHYRRVQGAVSNIVYAFTEVYPTNSVIKVELRNSLTNELLDSATGATGIGQTTSATRNWISDPTPATSGAVVYPELKLLSTSTDLISFKLSILLQEGSPSDDQVLKVNSGNTIQVNYGAVTNVYPFINDNFGTTFSGANASLYPTTAALTSVPTSGYLRKPGETSALVVNSNIYTPADGAKDNVYLEYVYNGSTNTTANYDIIVEWSSSNSVGQTPGYIEKYHYMPKDANGTYRFSTVIHNTTSLNGTWLGSTCLQQTSNAINNSWWWDGSGLGRVNRVSNTSGIFNCVDNTSVQSAQGIDINSHTDYNSVTRTPASGKTWYNPGIQYSETSLSAAQSLTDSFSYSVSKSICTDTATVSLSGQFITPDTYIMLVFDGSGSMDAAVPNLQTMAGGSYFQSGSTTVKNPNTLRAVLQDFYATGQTELQGNTDSTTNGADAYDSHVYLLIENSEKTWAMLANSSSLQFRNSSDTVLGSSRTGFDITSGKDFEDADNIITMVFQDESSPYAASTSWSISGYRDTTGGATHKADLDAYKSAISGTPSGTNVYGHVFHLDNSSYSGLKPFLQAVETSTSTEMIGTDSGVAYDLTTTQGSLADDITYSYDGNISGTSAYFRGLVVDVLEDFGFNIP